MAIFRQLMTDYNQGVLTKAPAFAITLMGTQQIVDIFLLLFGLLAVLIAIFGKEFTSGEDAFGRKNDKPIPTWQGKLLFGVVGTALVLIAVTLLFR
jgi:hypothetical protein